MTRNNYTNSIGWDTIGRNKYGRDYWGGGLVKGELLGCHGASSPNLNASMDVVITISSGSLFQYGITGTLDAFWRRRGGDSVAF